MALATVSVFTVSCNGDVDRSGTRRLTFGYVGGVGVVSIESCAPPQEDSCEKRAASGRTLVVEMEDDGDEVVAFNSYTEDTKT